MGGPTDPAEAHFDKGLWGFDGTVWRKLPMVWGYSAELMQNLGGTATGVNWDQYSTAVPAGDVHVVNHVTLRNETRAPGRTEFLLYNGGSTYVHLAWVVSLLQYEPLVWDGSVVLPVGWRVRVLMAAIQVNDVIAGGLSGYKMKVAL